MECVSGETVKDILAIVGAISVFFIIWWVLMYLLDLVFLGVERLRTGRITDRKEYFKCELKALSYSFSDDPPLMRVLQRLADGINVSSVKELWRKEKDG